MTTLHRRGHGLAVVRIERPAYDRLVTWVGHQSVRPAISRVVSAAVHAWIDAHDAIGAHTRQAP